MFDKIISAILVPIFAFIALFWGFPVGASAQVFYEGELYSSNIHPDFNIPATLEKDAPELTYIGRIKSSSKKNATPTEELQGNHWSLKRGEVYLHEDGYLYLFPVLGDAYTLTHFPSQPV